MADTIFALSSGAPPAAIGVIRISGPAAGHALRTLGVALPKSRRATLRTLRGEDGIELDNALVLWMPGPASATGEDCAELHVHGGRATIAAVERALAKAPGLRRAEAGEFTRRSFANGRIDLAEAEGLGELLAAETELQRRSAIAMASGGFSRQIETWRSEVLGLSAAIEAVLDFSDEGEVGEGLPLHFSKRCTTLAADLENWLSKPRARPLRDGVRVVIAGPPNAGKSTLFNALIEAEAAITSPEAGTTRDVLTSAVAIEGIPFVFVDTAGLRDDPTGPVEAIGISRAKDALETADLILWLGDEGLGPATPRVWEIAAQIDRADAVAKIAPRHKVSAASGEGLDALRRDLIESARMILPVPGDIALNERQHRLLVQARDAMTEAAVALDPLLCAEGLRSARSFFDRIAGRSGVDDLLDALFGRFCIGK